LARRPLFAAIVAVLIHIVLRLLAKREAFRWIEQRRSSRFHIFGVAFFR